MISVTSGRVRPIPTQWYLKYSSSTLKCVQACPFTKPNVWFLPPPFALTMTNYELQGKGWATRAPFAQTMLTNIVIPGWCKSVIGANLKDFYVVELQIETCFDNIFHPINWFLHEPQVRPKTNNGKTGRNVTQPSNEPCKTRQKHDHAPSPHARTPCYGFHWVTDSNHPDYELGTQLELSGDGHTGFAQRIGKELFYDYFGHVLFQTVLPRRQSVTYNHHQYQPRLKQCLRGWRVVSIRFFCTYTAVRRLPRTQKSSTSRRLYEMGATPPKIRGCFPFCVLCTRWLQKWTQTDQKLCF